MSKHKYPLTHEEFKSIYSKVPRLTVEVLLKTEKGLVLTKRAVNPYIGDWHIPGGTVYYKETLEMAVKRVAKNEIGVDVKIKRFVGIIHYPQLIIDQGWDWPIGCAFEVEKIGGEFETDDQGDEIGFFDNVPENMVPSQGEFLIDKGILSK